MNSSFYYSFPAIRGIQAKGEYFVIMCPLNILSKLFIFNEDQEVPPEYRAQRILNKNRIPEIAEYIINNPGGYVFSSLTASVDGEFEFIPIDNEKFKNNGLLKLSMESILLINDGQHRKYAIEEAIKVNPNLKDETISIVLFVDKGLKRSQQIFSDLNKHAVNVSKSIGILYDSRDEVAILTKEIINSIKYLKSYTDLENSTLSKFSNKLFTLSNIYKSNKKIIGRKPINSNGLKKFINDYWSFLINDFVDWQIVFNKKTNAYNSRKESISSYGVVLEALGIVGNYIYDNNLKDWKNYLTKINEINWSRSNLEDWDKRVISSSGRISKNSKCIRLTANLIKQKIGLPLTKEEESLENKFKEEISI